VSDLLRAWLLHKQCDFKDMDAKRLFERSVTVADVVAVLRDLDALKQQNAELLAAQQWQPIKSAPKDEVLFLRNEVMGLSGVGYFNSYLDCWSWSYSSEPTHYMLIPAGVAP
jgi:hypothetical protein